VSDGIRYCGGCGAFVNHCGCSDTSLATFASAWPTGSEQKHEGSERPEPLKMFDDLERMSRQ
jgi:hypothetical protein